MTRLGQQEGRPPSRQYAYPEAAAEKTETTETQEHPGAASTAKEKTPCMSAHPVGAMVYFIVRIILFLFEHAQQRFGKSTLEWAKLYCDDGLQQEAVARKLR